MCALLRSARTLWRIRRWYTSVHYKRARINCSTRTKQFVRDQLNGNWKKANWVTATRRRIKRGVRGEERRRSFIIVIREGLKKKLHKNNSRFRTNDSRANLLRRVRDAVFARDTVNESFYFFLVDFDFSTNVKRRAIIIDYTCSSFDVYYKVVFTINDVRVILSYCDLRTRIILKYIDDRFFFQ